MKQSFKSCALIFAQSFSAGVLILACAFRWMPDWIIVCAIVVYACAICVKLLDEKTID